MLDPSEYLRMDAAFRSFEIAFNPRAADHSRQIPWIDRGLGGFGDERIDVEVEEQVIGSHPSRLVRVVGASERTRIVGESESVSIDVHEPVEFRRARCAAGGTGRE